ncbi:hypothetical protein IFM89_030649 [Coptis chinensis]|uniref:Zinc finger PHD-type domain-containing protein n=1 Tax=Coptis chinensis TaxID=261450 RepID=A0A835M4Y8_9MAGN|nr:hypothetical protein IFM89_030649 [Coptis chinensis]
MKSRSHRLPISEPPDDWGDGSWTVDCVCGVNFDDGEEMVNCDECGVWVHTRCSRYVKGDKSFACDKCKTKKKKITINTRHDNEETEVAQLLVELPTKTMRMDNPSAPPRSSFRLWTDIPIQDRVHVQGVPGGDPTLFHGLSPVFTSDLWKCSGYVPKKFNFQYRDFPCWDDDKCEDPVDRGADALFSLSKQIVSASPVEMLVGLRGSLEGSNKPSHREAKKRDINKSSAAYVHSGVSRETNHLRPFGLHLGKRKKDGLRSKDLNLSGKKKARISTAGLGAQQLDSPKVVETHFHDSKNGDKMKLRDPDHGGTIGVTNNKSKESSAANVHCAEDSFLRAKSRDNLAAEVNYFEDASKKVKAKANFAANSHHTEGSFKKSKPKDKLSTSVHHTDDSFKKGKPKDRLLAKAHHAEDSNKKVKPKDNLAAKTYQGVDVSKEAWKNTSLIEIVVKSENDHQTSMRTGSTSETVAVEVSLLEPNDVNILRSQEDLNTPVDGFNHLNDKCDLGDSYRSSFNTVSESLKLKPPVEDLSDDATEVQQSRVLQDSDNSTSPCSLQPDSKMKTDGNEDQPEGKASNLSSALIDVKLDSTENLDQHLKISVSEQSFEALQVSKTLTTNIPSDEDAAKVSKALSDSDKVDMIEGMISISGEPCQTREVISSAGTVSVQESSSELKHLKSVEEPLKVESTSPRPPSPLTQHKVIVDSWKSSSTAVISKSEVLGSSKPPGRPASPSTLRPIHFTKRVKVNSHADIKKVHTLPETVRDDLKEAVLYPSSKASVAQNVAVSSSSVEFASTLPPQSASQVQNKTTVSDYSEKGERTNQSGSHQSSKVTHSSSMHPPAPVKSTLSDEELALLLHQELNSSPRVPRVPRVRHGGSIPQLASPAATNMLIKRTCSSGLKDQILVSKRKSKEGAPKDGSRNSREFIHDAKKMDKVLSSHDQWRQDQVFSSDVSAKKETLGGSSEVGHSAKKNAPSASTATLGQSTESADQNQSPSRNSPKDTSEEDDDSSGGITGPATRTLPGLLDQIMSKGRRMTYEELCNAVLPHWNNLRKHNGERYAYSSHSQAVLDCLRNRNEWAQLVDRGPKTNGGRKKRKPDSESPLVETEEIEYAKGRTTKELESKIVGSHREDFPKGKRKARKRRRLALQGRGVREARKGRKPNAVMEDDLGSFSHSSDNDIFSEDSRGASTRPLGNEASSSSDEAGSM